MATHYISIVVLLASLITNVVATQETILSDVDLLEFPLNLEYLEAEFFLFGALGQGLDAVAPELADGGPKPIGAKVAKLKDRKIKEIFFEFGLQEVGHLRAIKSTVKGFSRPLLNLSKSSFAKLIDSAFEKPLHPPFDPYANDINFLLASYLFPYVGLTGYVGANSLLQKASSRQLVAGLLGVKAGQDASIRTLLFERRTLKVKPYGVSVAEFTDRISTLRDILGNGGVKDVGLNDLASGKIGTILAADESALSYSRSPQEILRIIYGSGNESVPGGFYPKGGNGRIARSYLHTA